MQSDRLKVQTIQELAEEVSSHLICNAIAGQSEVARQRFFLNQHLYSATATLNMSKTWWGKPVSKRRKEGDGAGVWNGAGLGEWEVIHTSRWVVNQKLAYI